MRVGEKVEHERFSFGTVARFEGGMFGVDLRQAGMKWFEPGPARHPTCRVLWPPVIALLWWPLAPGGYTKEHLHFRDGPPCATQRSGKRVLRWVLRTVIES